MSASILHGVGRDILTLPEDGFVQAMRNLPARMSARLAFMTRRHHQVRDFVVRELPRQRTPLRPGRIAQGTGLQLHQVTRILADLEQHLFFLARDAGGNVGWAFPVTTSRTPHRLIFSTGEKIFGAWAEDALATSFVQGRLRGEKLRVRIESSCRHCSLPIALEVDDDLRWRVLTPGVAPLLFEPDMDWQGFHGPNIIHDYWMQTVFFWSEEHARKYRAKQGQPDGLYLTMHQAAFSERIAQSGLFAIGDDGCLLR